VKLYYYVTILSIETLHYTSELHCSELIALAIRAKFDGNL